VFVVLALSLVLGPHWTLLQTVAWTGMLIHYAQGGSFKEALLKTFDGHHPCGLCLTIRKGQQEEQRNRGQCPGEKPEPIPELFCDHGRVAIPRPPMAETRSSVFPLEHCSDFIESPPTPPPRVTRAVL